MAKKQTIRSSLFQPTEPIKQTASTMRAANQSLEATSQASKDELRHHTSTRLPLTVHEYFEELAVEHGYSAHSLRIYALSWFVKEHQAGRVALERDRSIKGKRALAMPKV